MPPQRYRDIEFYVFVQCRHHMESSILFFQNPDIYPLWRVVTAYCVRMHMRRLCSVFSVRDVLRRATLLKIVLMKKQQSLILPVQKVFIGTSVRFN